MRSPILASMLLVAVSAVAVAQDSTQAPAPAPAPAAAEPSPASLDSAAFIGDWEWAAQLQDAQLTGTFRINKGPEGRYTGVVTRQGLPGNNNAPIRSFTIRRRSFTLTAEFDGEMYTFQGQLEGNARRSVNGTMSTRGGMGRLRAEKRS